ncbi:MAG: DUF4159 domain-containing protein [Gemmatimonadetes bacterium]|nr:DUF4159 domain-containing protein [Gemmatimonadota bacterium]MYC70280.1 DUF4159 domain-containing protein [Gemmatimonadota bacterium]MYI60599.1 DUF4159 domain-containing protein [Gemmatimonadota bacterium]
MSKKWVSTRFASPTQDFDLDSLVRRLRRGFFIALASAAALLLIVVAINPFEKDEKKTPRPLTTKFIKREPRLTKPLELRKIPQPKRQLARREVQLAQARMDQVQATASFNTRSLIAGVGGSGIRLSGQTAFSTMSGMTIEPKLTAAAVTSTRTSEHKIDMGLEMLDVNNMDTGRYRAIIVQDATDKQAIKGFVKLAQVMSSRALAGGTSGYGTVTLRVKTIDRIRDVLNEYTGLKAEFLGFITFDDPRLMEIPVIVEPQGAANDAEMANLAQYLMSGGFMLSGIHEEALEKYGGLVRGKDFWSERLPEDHPVFTSFFDLSGGMPFGYSPSLGQGKLGVRPWNYLRGYYIKGRLAGVTPGDGGWGWQNDGRGGDSTRQLQLAVNIIIYALTQEGSITQRLMQMVN